MDYKDLVIWIYRSVIRPELLSAVKNTKTDFDDDLLKFVDRLFNKLGGK